MEKKSVSVTLEHVTKKFKDVKGKADVIAVNDSHFVIEPGELVTLLGPSGCGKTTTLRMIAGFELPTEGKIYIGNEEVTMLPPNKRDTATMFQSYGLFPHMTVFDNVAYGLRLRKVPQEEITKRVNETLALVGLATYGDRAPSKLSGGQQQRVSIARALVKKPSVILADEPTANLDSVNSEMILQLMKDLNEKHNSTFIFSTHDQMVLSYVNRIISLKDGLIMSDETKRSV